MADFVLPQPGLFALGTPVQTFLEFDLFDPSLATAEVLATVQDLVAGVKTGQGCNVVVGFRPTLWRTVRPDACPDGLHDFEAAIVGDDGFTMPATQHDLVVWVAGGRPDSLFDEGRNAVDALARIAALAHENKGWNYHGNVDLTGFTDGTENPTLAEASEICLVADGPGVGASLLLLQEWRHDLTAWADAGTAVQERAIGRTKADNAELDPKPAGAHNARTDQDVVGKTCARTSRSGECRIRARSSSGWPPTSAPCTRCCCAWPASTASRATTSRATRPRTQGPTTCCPRPKRSRSVGCR